MRMLLIIKELMTPIGMFKVRMGKHTKQYIQIPNLYNTLLMKLLQGNELYAKLNKMHLNYRDYVQYIHDHSYHDDWKGFSIQQKKIEENDSKADSFYDNLIGVKNYTDLVVDIINYTATSNWVILRDNNRLKWIYKKGDEVRILSMFQKEDIDVNYRGAFLLAKSLLRQYLPIIIGYSYYNKREDVNLVSEKGDFVIRFTHHFSVDIISTNLEKLNKIKEIAKQVNLFKIVMYRD